MTVDPQELARFEEAVSAKINGTATAGQVAYIEACCLADRTYTRLYVEQMDTYCLLELSLAKKGGERAVRPRFNFGVLLKVAACVAVLLGVAGSVRYALLHRGQGCALCVQDSPQAEPTHLAQVKGSYYGVREDGSAIREGDTLAKGLWRWQNGLVDVEMASGTMLLVQAPALIEVYDDQHIRIYQGRVVVTMPEGKSGFTVDTHQMNVVDLGTQFGIGVNLLGESRVQVFEGSVLVMSTIYPDQQVLTEGGTLRVMPDGRLKSTKLSDTAFARRLPEVREKQADKQMAVNTPEYHSMEVAYMERPIRIDGNLDEWRDIPAFRAACRPPFNRTHTVEGRLAYDENNLYISANIGDPHPLMNQRRDELQHDRVTGGVIVHFAPEKKTDTDGFGLVLWYDAEREQPDLMIETRNEDGRLLRRRAEAWDGAFRKHANGYTLEYRIPWTTMGLTAAPQAQDVLSNCWDVHWYDAEGRVMTARLIENVNAASAMPPNVYNTYRPTWGKAVFSQRK